MCNKQLRQPRHQYTQKQLFTVTNRESLSSLYVENYCVYLGVSSNCNERHSNDNAT